MPGGRRPRVLHLTTSDMSLALLLGNQLRAFADAGYEVIGASEAGPYVTQLDALGIRHIALSHVTRAVAPSHDAQAVGELYRLFRRLSPDIVHTHNPKPGIYGRLAARAARVPVVVNTVHGLYAQPEDRLAKRGVVYGLERLAATCSDAELVQNPEDVAVLARLRVPPGRLHLLGNGVDLRRFSESGIPPARRAELRRQLGVEPGDLLCGVVGRLVWEKGYREVFAAIPAVRRRAPGVRFVIVGPREPAKADAVSDADVAAVEAGGGVVFAGSRDDMVELYAAMDLYVLASYREGYPRSAMEAAAMGLPVIATDVRGCRQVVDHGRTGLLVPPHDAEALARAIVTVATDADARRTMGSAARRRAAELFDERRVIDLTLGIYDALLPR